MTRYRFLVLLIPYLAFMGGIAVAAPQARIVGGDESLSGDWPYMTALMSRSRAVHVGEREFSALAMTGSASGEVSGILADCGLAGSQCEAVSGKICLIQRGGDIDFSVKIENCQNGGGIGGIIYNNIDGIFSGTLQDFQAAIPAVSVSQSDGTALLNELGNLLRIDYSARIPDTIFCGATLIDPGWVITAAHCVVGKSPDSILVNVGGHDLRTDQENILAVVRIVSHTGFNPVTIRNDVALLELESAVTGITPASLATTEGLNQAILAGSFATALGRGSQAPLGENERPQASAPIYKLFEVDLPLVPSYVCNLAFQMNQGISGAVTSEMLCAGRATGGVGTCFGDSGGPLLLRDVDGSYQLAGITSWGIGCAQAELYDVYARVPFFAAAIEAVISGKSADLKNEAVASGSGAWNPGLMLFLWILGIFHGFAGVPGYRRIQ